jgi:hypothetical protein
MPKIEDIISDSVKNKLSDMKNKRDTVKGTIVNDGTNQNDFIGQTPNLNSSLGVNAYTGAFKSADESGGEVPQTSSKVNTFFTKNENIIESGINAIAGIFGMGPSAQTDTGYTAPPVDDKKKGLPWWAWLAIAVVFIVIVYFTVKAIKKNG